MALDEHLSEQVAQQVDLTIWPRFTPDSLDHQGVGHLAARQPDSNVLMDPHPGAGVGGTAPTVPGIEPVIVGEEQYEVHCTGSCIFGHLAEQPCGQAARTAAGLHADVDNPERTENVLPGTDDPELYPHLADDVAAHDGNKAKVRRELVIVPVWISSEARL
jgi:hypothetical protein